MIPTTETFPPMKPCPLCGHIPLHEKTRFGYYCDSLCRCTNCKTLIVNGEPEKTIHPYSKIVFLNDVITTGLNILWNRLPRWAQSTLIIGLWIFIMGSSIYQTVANPWEYRTIPLAVCAILVSMLGIFYIVMELKGELRKR
jgi:hypothetical protein